MVVKCYTPQGKGGHSIGPARGPTVAVVDHVVPVVNNDVVSVVYVVFVVDVQTFDGQELHQVAPGPGHRVHDFGGEERNLQGRVQRRQRGHRQPRRSRGRGPLATGGGGAL